MSNASQKTLTVLETLVNLSIYEGDITINQASEDSFFELDSNGDTMPKTVLVSDSVWEEDSSGDIQPKETSDVVIWASVNNELMLLL